jgi:hypothetical protein
VLGSVLQHKHWRQIDRICEHSLKVEWLTWVLSFCHCAWGVLEVASTWNQLPWWHVWTLWIRNFANHSKTLWCTIMYHEQALEWFTLAPKLTRNCVRVRPCKSPILQHRAINQHPMVVFMVLFGLWRFDIPQFSCGWSDGCAKSHFGTVLGSVQYSNTSIGDKLTEFVRIRWRWNGLRGCWVFVIVYIGRLWSYSLFPRLEPWKHIKKSGRKWPSGLGAPRLSHTVTVSPLWSLVTLL